MTYLVGFPILAVAVILQSTVFSRVTLLNGPADLVLLIIASWAMQDHPRDEWAWALIGGLLMSLVSALPVWLPFAGYFGVTGLALYFKRRVWQLPLLALFVVVFSGTALINLLSFAALRLSGRSIDLSETLNLILLPSLLLNLLLAIPVHGLITEVSRWVFPRELEA
jgi:rod shape-determining protein MreD